MNVGNTELITPVIAVPAAGASVTFQNLFNMQFESLNPNVGYDGMVLEISINGGAYADIITAGGGFVTGGYTHTISASFSSPIAGRRAWSGVSAGTEDSPAYITTTVKLPAAANGQPIQLKWRVACDNGGVAAGNAGVRIDTIIISSCSTATPTPTPATPTPTPATPTPTPTPHTPTPTPATPTPTPTPATPTPTPATPTPTPATPTPTPTPHTPTPTPATPTPTPTPATPTPTPTPATPTPTPTPATPTPTPTPPTPTPTPTPAAQAVNLSTRLRVQTGDNVGIGGFIIAGSAPKHLLIRAIGPSLTQFGVPNALPDPVLELHGPGAFATITNDNWRDDPLQEALILATGLAPTNNLESAIDATLNPGAYTAVVRGKNNTTGVASIEVYDLSQAVASKLGNISTRAFVSTADDIVIAGFILGNHSGDDRIVVRGIGPSLTGFGVPDALADPTLELRDSNGALLNANNNWQDDAAQAAELTAAGLAPANPLESGIAATLPPGLYTALLAGVNNGTGVGLVEVYDRGAP